MVMMMILMMLMMVTISIIIFVVVLSFLSHDYELSPVYEYQQRQQRQ